MKTNWTTYAIGLINLICATGVACFATFGGSEFSKNLIYFAAFVGGAQFLFFLCPEVQNERARKLIALKKAGKIVPIWLARAHVAIPPVMLIGYGWFWCGAGMLLGGVSELCCREEAFGDE